jgi:hypothetical protein
VVLDVHGEQRMAVLHCEQAGLQRGRVQVIGKLGHDAEVHCVLLLVPVIHPLEGTKPTNQNTCRISGDDDRVVHGALLVETHIAFLL